MITRHVIRPNAAEDLDEQLDYYETEAGLEIALRFFDAVEEAIQFLYRYPDAGSPKAFANPRLKDLRSWPIPGFENIRLYYFRSDENTLCIVRVLHGKRDLARVFKEEQG